MLKRVAAIIFALVLMATYLFYPILLDAIESDEEPIFLGFNDTPRDISGFVSDMKGDSNYTVRTVVTTPGIFEQNMVDPERTLYIAAGIEREYTENEIDAIKSFIKAGGHAIIADDFGYVQPLADEFNITYYTGQFYDQRFDKNVNFPICEAVLGLDQGRWQYQFSEGDIPTSSGQYKVWQDEPDGIWDDNDDGDRWVDEDVLDDIDNDQDNRKLTKNHVDDDFDSEDENAAEEAYSHDSFLDGSNSLPRNGKYDLGEKTGKDKKGRDGGAIWVDLNKAIEDFDITGKPLDNDNDGIANEVIDESTEGVDEDTWDDDGDWIDKNKNGYQDPYEIGVNEESLNGINDDEKVYIFGLESDNDMIYTMFQGAIPDKLQELFTEYNILFSKNVKLTSETELTIDAIINMLKDADVNWVVPPSWKIVDGNREFQVELSGDGETFDIYKLDHMIDEDLFHYQLIMNKPVGLYSFKTETNVIARGSENSYVDLNNNEKIELPEEGSTNLADRVSTAANRVELIVEVVDPSFVGTGSVVFIADADLFTNDLFSLDHMSIDYEDPSHSLFAESRINTSSLHPDDKADGDNLADNTPDSEPDYDNQKFMKELIYYLFHDKFNSDEDPEILVLIDDSRHGEDAVWLRPMYGSLRVTSVLTSQSCYVLVSSIFLFVGLFLVVLLSKGQLEWEHEFNVRTFKKRSMVPVASDLKKSRLRRAVIEKVRMDRGLSPEEFREVDPRDIDRLIGNPQLIQLVRDEKISYSPEDFRRLIEIINKWKK